VSTTLIRVIAIGALPMVVFCAGAGVMAQASNLEHVDRVVAARAAAADRRPPHFRLGYGTDEIGRYWAAIVTDAAALRAERRFLHLDLVFPLVYGAGLMAGLVMAWSLLGRPFSRAWLAAPVTITVLADWTENLVQIAQLQRYVDGGVGALQDGWIHVASSATIVKLLSFAGVSLLLAALLILAVCADRPT
jgi:hypothetical protein